MNPAFEFLQFDPLMLQAVTNGKSPLDHVKLHIQSYADADLFLKSYGFDWRVEAEQNFLWSVYRRALVFSREQLNITNFPEEISDAELLGDLRNLLVIASGEGDRRNLQAWACGLLRVMHVFVHTENDLSNTYAEAIQNQVLSPFESIVRTDGKTGKPSLIGARDQVPLEAFEQKPFKTTTSTTLKLLARADLFTMNVFDKIGVRFVADSILNVFRVLRLLMQENLIAVPHLMSDQSSNNLFPADLFCQIIGDETGNEILFEGAGGDPTKWQNSLQAKLETALSNQMAIGHADLFRKGNHFSAKDYRFIKFISRKLIRIPKTDGGQPEISFFYPFEIQILDLESYTHSKRDESSHQAYKDRQRRAARDRAFPNCDGL